MFSRVYWWRESEVYGEPLGVLKNEIEFHNNGMVISYYVRWDIPNKVCDDHFGSDDARAVCNTLGYFGGTASFATVQPSQYSSGITSVPIHHDDVNCEGTDYFQNCYKLYGHNCGHHEDVVITCHWVKLNKSRLYFMHQLWVYCHQHIWTMTDWFQHSSRISMKSFESPRIFIMFYASMYYFGTLLRISSDFGKKFRNKW